MLKYFLKLNISYKKKNSWLLHVINEISDLQYDYSGSS